jgi:DNA mismatch repair protein MutS
MPFETDSQTLQDLSLIGINGHPAILELFKPVTLGGVLTLKEIFAHPLNNLDLIQNRQDAIRFLALHQINFLFDKEEADFIDHYSRSPDRADTTSTARAVRMQFKNWLKPTSAYYVTQRGVRLLTYQIHQIADALAIYAHNAPPVIKDIHLQADELLGYIQPAFVQKSKAGKAFSAAEVEELDFIFRYTQNLKVKLFLAELYHLDVLVAAGKTADNLNFTYPEFTVSTQTELLLKGFFHPFVKDAVGNDIEFNHHANICFITGANMAGKSTALKSIGICTYLAHLGFPVPAAHMRTSVFNGLFTTINLADNVALGHSHFYREVLRIKEVATKVGTVKNLLVIFDELFRGTNVKDAYDASLAIIKAFSAVRNSVFMVSTHIVEVADQLHDADNLFFNCLTTTMLNDKAVYTYKLQPGISNERLGMRIIEDEGLLDIIKAQAVAP